MLEKLTKYMQYTYMEKSWKIKKNFLNETQRHPRNRTNHLSLLAFQLSRIRS